MRDGADRNARVHQQVDHDAPDAAGRSGDEHRRHFRPWHETAPPPWQTHRVLLCYAVRPSIEGADATRALP
ncbi:hypothetical protein GCM10023193_82100 [Planotetraspora kaengkrachanensis]